MCARNCASPPGVRRYRPFTVAVVAGTEDAEDTALTATHVVPSVVPSNVTVPTHVPVSWIEAAEAPFSASATVCAAAASDPDAVKSLMTTGIGAAVDTSTAVPSAPTPIFTRWYWTPAMSSDAMFVPVPAVIGNVVSHVTPPKQRVSPSHGKGVAGTFAGDARQHARLIVFAAVAVVALSLAIPSVFNTTSVIAAAVVASPAA